IAAVALGVAAIVRTSAPAFAVLKALGAAYLLYLAWQAFRAGTAQLQAENGAPLRPQALYLRGILMNVSNPKVAVFFLAFLPQFTDPARGAMAAQIIVLGIAFMLTALIIFSSIAWAADRLGGWLMHSKRAQSTINRLAGLIFVLLALRLALSEP